MFGCAHSSKNEKRQKSEWTTTYRLRVSLCMYTCISVCCDRVGNQNEHIRGSSSSPNHSRLPTAVIARGFLPRWPERQPPQSTAINHARVRAQKSRVSAYILWIIKRFIAQLFNLGNNDDDDNDDFTMCSKRARCRGICVRSSPENGCADMSDIYLFMYALVRNVDVRAVSSVDVWCLKEEWFVGL